MNSNFYAWLDRLLKLVAAVGATVMSWQTINNNTQAERHHQENIRVYKTVQGVPTDR